MDIIPILMTVLVVCAVLTVLSVIFNWLLSPVKDNQARIEKDLNQVKTEMNQVKIEMNQFKTEVNGELKELNAKLDKLLNK